MGKTIKFKGGKKMYDGYTLPPAKLSIDKVRIVSDVHADFLNAVLPMQELDRVSHSFTVEPMKKSKARLSGKYLTFVKFVHSHTRVFCDLLAEYLPYFGAYSITGLEVCLDFHFDTRDEAERGLEFIQKYLFKPWQRRDFIKRVYKGKGRPKKPDKGYINIATVYPDDRKCRSAQKSYARNPKIPGGIDPTKFIVRIEWSLKDKSTIVEKTGIKQIQDLLNPDFPIPKGEEFVAKYFRLLENHREELGKLLAPRYQAKRRKNASPKTPKQQQIHDRIFPNGEESHYYRQAANLHLRAGAAKEIACLVDPDDEEIDHVCVKWESTAQAKIYVRREIKAAKVAKRKVLIKAKKKIKNLSLAEARAMAKLDDHPKRMLAITRHRLKKCFSDITHDTASVEICRSVEHDDSEGVKVN